MEARMVPDWLLGSTEAVGPLLLGATIVITAVAVLLLIRLLRRNGPQHVDAEQIRREMLDECFAKGEMTREECEGRCDGLGHPREAPHPPPSASVDPRV
jgi:hypothetical protein